MRQSILIAILLLVLAGPALGQGGDMLHKRRTPEEAQISEIRKLYYKVQRQLVEQAAQVQRDQFCEAGQGGEDDPHSGYVDENALAAWKAKFGHYNWIHCFELIYVDGKLVKIREHGGTGDSALNVDYYFHENGTVAFLFEDYPTIVEWAPRGRAASGEGEWQSGYAIERRLYFDKKGILIRKDDRVVNATSREKADMSRIMNMKDMRGEDYHLKLSNFPVYHLIRK